MQLKIYNDHTELSYRAAREIIQLVIEKPDAVICLASGETPLLSYVLVAQIAAIQKVNFSRCTFIGLDEWVGIPPENEGSCHYFLHHYVFDPLELEPDQIHVFNALAKDLEKECRTMDEVIKAKGGIDLMVVGVGMNGHVGFNEPGVRTDLYSHVIDLDENTKTVGQKYFAEVTSLRQGITLGMRHFLEARHVLMLASSRRKAEIMRQVLKSEVSSAVPASLIRNHPNGILMMDEEAAIYNVPLL